MNAPRIATVLALAILLAVAAWAPLVDRDEPRYAQAVREMHQSGDLLVPKNFGQLRPDKPILIYWLQWAATALVGEREVGFRLPSFLALLAWLWLAAQLAQELCGEKRWALLPGMALAGVLATPDALVGALTTASLLAFVRAAKCRHPRWAFLAWLLFGLGVLAKGPVTPLFVLPALAGYCGRDRELLRAAVPWWGPLLSAAVVAAWFLPANLATDWDFARLGLGKHVVQRALSPLESHGIRGPLGVLLGPPFYVASLALAGFPLLLNLVRFLRAGEKQDPQVWRTVVWGVLGPMAVLSLVATKLPHYILPALPLLFVASRPTRGQQVAGAIASAVLALGLLLLTLGTPYRPAGLLVRRLPQLTCAFPLQEPSLRFYAGENLIVTPSTNESCGFWLLRAGEEEKLRGFLAPNAQPIRTFSGWNLAKGRKETLRLYQLKIGRREKENPGPGGSSAESPTGRGFILAAKNGFPSTLRTAILAR